MKTSLDLFRHIWQEEISKDKSTETNTNACSTSSNDLCQIGANAKSSFENGQAIPTVSNLSTNFNSINHSDCSFTIGIRTFTTTSSPPSVSIELPAKKKQKTTARSLIDELIHDIDEITEVPFFNIFIPREIGLQIFEYLSLTDIYSCLQVCKSWHSLLSDELLWSNIYKQLKIINPILKLNNQTWKDYVRETIVYQRKLIHNFRTHQCQTTKLTHYLGLVLTCMNRNQTNIVAGYSSGIIRTWSIEQILDNSETIPEIIYESTENIEPSLIQSVGFLREKIYAVHDDGLIEIWLNMQGNRPIFTQQIDALPIERVMNDDNYLCLTNRSKFIVCKFHDNSSSEYHELNFHEQFNDSIVSMCISTSHYTPIGIIAGQKSIWCLALNNLDNRLSFYSNYSSKYVPIDIHDHQPLAIIGIDNEIKIIDLQQARCEILSTNYKYLPSSVHLIRGKQCPPNEFVIALKNSQISLFDKRQPYGAVQHFYNARSAITTLQIDTWKLASTDSAGFIRLWDRRMNSHSLWHMNPQTHPVTYCSFDEQTLICALTPFCRQPDMIEYNVNPNAYSGHIYVCNFNSDVSTQLDEDLKICTSGYDAPKASNRRIGLQTPYDLIE